MSAPLPDVVLSTLENEERVAMVKRMVPLLTQPSEEFEQIVNLAATRFSVPHSSISLIDASIQHSLATFGALDSESAIENSFCAHAISHNERSVFVVPDCAEDPRFQNNPLVRDAANPIRFYAGAAYRINGHVLGTLYVLDTKPHHELSEEHLGALRKLANLVERFIELRTGIEGYQQAAKRHERVERRFELATRASGMATWIWDLRTDDVDGGEELRNLFGVTHSRPLKAKDVFEAIHPDDRAEVDHAVALTLSEGKSYEAEFRLANSPDVWIAGQGGALEWSESGDCLTIAGINYDISDQKRDEHKTKLLLRELNHRVKNTLAMLQSIASQTLRNAKSPEEFKTAFSGRIRSIAMAHTLLSDEEWEPVDLKRLLEDQVMLYSEDPERQIVLKGEMPLLGPEESLALGMVMHELASNALKYGALSSETGTVTVDVEVQDSEDAPLLHLHWQEKGGPGVTKPKRQGFGVVMIKRSLDKLIGSKVALNFEPEGVTAEICMPLRKI